MTSSLHMSLMHPTCIHPPTHSTPSPRRAVTVLAARRCPNTSSPPRASPPRDDLTASSPRSDRVDAVEPAPRDAPRSLRPLSRPSPSHPACTQCECSVCSSFTQSSPCSNTCRADTRSTPLLLEYSIGLSNKHPTLSMRPDAPAHYRDCPCVMQVLPIRESVRQTPPKCWPKRSMPEVSTYRPPSKES